MMDFETKPAPS